jgi:hypothetical protein
MRNVIKNILNEEVENIQNIEKGIDISVKLLSKKFPFVVGWKHATPMDQYEYSLYIYLKLDVEKVKEYYGLELDYIYGNYPEFLFDESIVKAYPISAFKYEGIIDDPYLETKELSTTLGNIYDDMPDKVKYYGTFGSKNLMIDGYIYVK